jgi:hypothetical protein
MNKLKGKPVLRSYQDRGSPEFTTRLKGQLLGGGPTLAAAFFDDPFTPKPTVGRIGEAARFEIAHMLWVQVDTHLGAAHAIERRETSGQDVG